MNEHYKDYVLIGPYFEEKALNEFEELEVPEKYKKIFTELENEGIVCHYGKWLVKGEPVTILIDTANFAHEKDNLKKLYWDEFEVDSLFSSWDFEEPMLWSTAAGKLIDKFQKEKDE